MDDDFSVLVNLDKFAADYPARVLSSFVAKVKGVPEEEVRFKTDNLKFSKHELAHFLSLLFRYDDHEPISKILNRRAFWESDFFINEDVLDPRPETEIIIERTLELFEKHESFRFLDIGTGSGCILLSIAKEFRRSYGIGIDVNEKAIAVARKNKKDLHVENVEIKNVDWNYFEPKKKFDLIVSNPPYIKTADISKLDDSVKDFDPHIALDGGENGLEAYEQLSDLIKDWLNPDGKVLLEIGYNQYDDVKNLFKSKGYLLVNSHKDFQKIRRVLEFSIASNHKMIA